MSHSARLTSSQRPSLSSRPVPIGARSNTSSKSPPARGGFSRSACRRAVMSSTTATPPAIAASSSLAPVQTQRADVHHQAVALLRRPDLARARLAVERRAKQRLQRPPQLRRERLLHELAVEARVRRAQALERLARGQHEAQVPVEHQDQRLRQLAQRRRRRLIGARDHVGVLLALLHRGRHVPCIGLRGGLLDSQLCTQRGA